MYVYVAIVTDRYYYDTIVPGTSQQVHHHNRYPVNDLAVIIFDQAEIPDYKMKMAKPGHIDINAVYIFYLE